MSLEVSIKGQDRRHAVDILLREIDQRRAELSNHGRYYGNEVPKILSETKFSKKLQKELATLRALDEEKRKVHMKVEAAKRRVLDALGDTGQLDTAAQRGQTWRRYVVRETDQALRDRIEGNAEARSEKSRKLADLKDRVVMALAGDDPLEPLIQEFRSISGGRFVG